jgi:hypothetical protein
MPRYSYGRNCRWFTVMPQRRSTGQYERRPPIDQVGVCTFAGSSIREMSCHPGFCECKCPVKETRYEVEDTKQQPT